MQSISAEKKWIYLNNSYLSSSKAKISVFDRGFLFGDGVYEVIPVFQGSIIEQDLHLERLQKSLDAIQLPFVTAEYHFSEIFQKLLRKNRPIPKFGFIYLQITRGEVIKRGFNLKINNIKPTVLVFFSATASFAHNRLISSGQAAITLPDARSQYCYIKSISLLPSLLLHQEVTKACVIEAILIRNGYAVEGISSSIFTVKNGSIITPPLSKENLSGITRHLLIQLAKDNFISLYKRRIKKSALYRADEIWVTSSTKGIIPIVKLDGKLIGNGKVGVVWRKMNRLYMKELGRSVTFK